MSATGNTTSNKTAPNQILPPNWKSVKLREVIDISHGFPFSSEYFTTDGEFTLLTPGNFYEEGGFRSAGEKQKFFTGQVPSDYVLPPKTLIVAMTEQADGLLGSAALVPQDNKYLHNQRIGRVSIKSNALPEYLLYLFNGKNFRSKVRETAAGTKVKHTSPEKLISIEVLLPSSEEQLSICSALSEIDALISSLDQLIAKKRDIQQAAMQQLLTGQRRLPGFSGEWEVKRLGDFGQCLRGVSYKGDADLLAYDTDETYRLLRSNNVQQSAIDTDGLQFVNARCVSNHQILKPKDILICMANGSKDLVGKAGLFEVSDGHRYTFGAFMGCFRMKTGAEPDFIFALFGTHKYKNYIANLLAGSSINNLRPSDIEKMEFHFPSKNEQAAIATIVSDMDSELAALEARLDKARQLKQGMMQELLTGRIRLIDKEPV